MPRPSRSDRAPRGGRRYGLRPARLPPRDQHGTKEVNEAGQELNLSTADHLKVGFHPWLNIRSARWLRIESAPTDPASIAACRAYFDRLWTLGGADLSAAQLESWNDTVIKHRAGGGKPPAGASLGDFGADAGIGPSPPTTLPVVVADASQAFVKFLGESGSRVPLSCFTAEEIERAGCHRVLAYPATKRPRRVKDDALMYIARLTEQPNDIRIFGRAIGMAYVEGRDDASAADISRRPWRTTWSRYIRVHQAEFVAGAMTSAVSLNNLMDDLGADAFASTQRNATKGEGNTDPRHAYRQAAHVELSSQGLAWVRDRLQAAFDEHGTVPNDVLAAIQP